MCRFLRENSYSLSTLTLMIVLGLGVIAAPAQAAQWSTPVQPPAGCRSTPAGAPSLAVNASGAWVVAAYAQTGSGLEAFGVSACTSNDGVNWSGPIVIGQGTSPAVAIAPDGRAVVVWQGDQLLLPTFRRAYGPRAGTGAPQLSSAPCPVTH
jgi:hypothetical protein